MESGCGSTHAAPEEPPSSHPNRRTPSSHHGALDGSTQSILDSCQQVCHRFQEDLECDSLFILHRSKWRCLTSTYSRVLGWLGARVLYSNSGQDVLCQKLTGSFEALHHAMRAGEQCFEDCTCKISNINHSWLVEQALKLSMSTDIVDMHLHDVIWAYAMVMEQEFWLGIDFKRLEQLEHETSILCGIWAAADTTGDLCQAQEQLRNKFRCEEEDETSRLASFIVHKLGYMNEDKLNMEAHHVLPDFFWVDPEGLRRNADSLIGRGSFGVVFEAVWLGGCFAVKDIFYAGEDKVCEGEQAILARLHHPNVMSLVCCTKDISCGRYGMVMERMQQNLQVMMKGRKKKGEDPPFTLLEAIDLMLQIAKGMEYLHSLNIMHRDLKSPNILVSFPDVSDRQMGHRTVRLKITDFGMAKAKEMSSYFTTKPTGTLAWRAPELFRNQGVDGHARYNKKADVYSFGLVCYEILTGETPFKEISPNRLLKRLMKGERPQLPPHCPKALASFIQRCWDGKPEARPGFTCICRMLRYFKACILLKSLHDPPNAAHNWLSCRLSSGKCDLISDKLEAQKKSIDALPPLNILVEMYWCRMILQEIREDGKSSTMMQSLFNCFVSSNPEGDSLHVMPNRPAHTPPPSPVHHTGIETNGKEDPLHLVPNVPAYALPPYPTHRTDIETKEFGDHSRLAMIASTSKKIHEEGRWVEQFEPGVYITLCTLPDGTTDLRSVRFSRRKFLESQAEEWWTKNRTRVYEQYNISIALNKTHL